jgi:cytochrome b6-f complex iron-sulfur subunit
MWGLVLKEEMMPTTTAVATSEEALVGRSVTVGGRVFTPVAPRALAAQAAGGAAIAIETVDAYPISRRGILRITFWAGLGAGVAALAGVLVDMLYPRGITGFGGVISVGTVDQFAPGTKTPIQAGKLWLVNLTQEQGGPGILALYWKCPHLGCTVPWRETFVFADPTTGQESPGWFRCPCHGSTYNHAGVRVYRDKHHITATYMRTTVPAVWQRLSPLFGAAEQE